jgi:hypothetical protein
LAKTHESLKRLAKLSHLPLLFGGHDEDQKGQVTDLRYRRLSDGTGVLVGQSNVGVPQGWGCSLQYEGKIRGNKIITQISDRIHAAILSNPRDSLTVSDGTDYALLFTDSAGTDPDVAPTDPLPEEDQQQNQNTTPEPREDLPSEAPEADGQTSIEIDPEEIIATLLQSEPAIELLISTISTNERLIQAIVDRVKPVEPAVEVAPPTATRIVVKSKQPEQQKSKPISIIPKQQTLKPLE